MRALTYLWLMLVIIIVVVIVILLGFMGGLIYSNINKDASNAESGIKESVEIELPSTISESIISTQQITSLLQRLGASSLHNPLFSKDTPKIEIETEDASFYSEIVKGSIITKKGSISNEDIRIVTTNEEIINALESDNTLEYIKSSVIEGKTSIEQVASTYTLYSKGYLSLYKSVTGQSIFDVF
ncbi:hypothetical protein HYV49_05790 [Candidatus Pacearchaeota archaeon]|nr:hypothetical protein [Candidatus Pacearchaeota archaeon]